MSSPPMQDNEDAIREIELELYRQSKKNFAIARKLDISNPDELHDIKFQVDGHKLQKMLTDQTAKKFFKNIMHTTKTYIEWPSEFTDEDHPYIKVYGRPDDVEWTRVLVLDRLPTDDARVKLRMLIHQNDHCFILGYGKTNLKRLMIQSGALIEFPEIKTSAVEKLGHRVYISGTLDSTERARSLLRAVSPLTMSYELPRGQPRPPIDILQEKYDLQIEIVKVPESLHSLVLVQDCVRKSYNVLYATKELMSYMNRNIANTALVTILVDIPPPYQYAVKGPLNTNLFRIMQKTKTGIFFPLPNDNSDESQVRIRGTIESTFDAYKELMNYLPIKLKFDIHSYSYVNEIMGFVDKFGVNIKIRQTPPSLGVTIGGPENLIKTFHSCYKEAILMSTAESPEI